MRLLGSLPAGQPAGSLLAALAARGIGAELREGGIWLLDEERRAEAAALLEHHAAAPEDPAWRRVARAELARHERERREAREALATRSRRSWRRERRLRRAWQGAVSSRPLTLVLLSGGILTAALGPRDAATLLPLLASLFWLHELGTHVEALRGSRRFAALVLSLAAATQLALGVATFGVAGLSGVAFGLLGFTAARSRKDTEAGLSVPRGLLPLMATWLLACAAGAAPASVFLAQCAGLATGLLAGLLPPVLLRRRAA